MLRKITLSGEKRKKKTKKLCPESEERAPPSGKLKREDLIIGIVVTGKEVNMFLSFSGSGKREIHFENYYTI